MRLPTNSTRPVPIRFRRPSTSLMMRDTSAPVLFVSWNVTAKRPMWDCTLRRSSAIMRWAAFDSNCVSVNDVRPCIAVAARMASTRGTSNCTWRLPITLSTNTLSSPGARCPAARLTAIRARPANRSQRCGRTNGHDSPSRRKKPACLVDLPSPAPRAPRPGTPPPKPCGLNPGISYFRGLQVEPAPVYCLTSPPEMLGQGQTAL